MTRTPDRAKLIDFSLPIMTESLGALTLEGKPFKNLMDLNSPDVTLAEVRGTTPIPWIAANLPRAKVLQLDNHPDVLRAVAQDERSQLRNRELAVERLVAKLRSALAVPRRRVATRPSQTARARRVDEKKRRSRTKELRRPPSED